VASAIAMPLKSRDNGMPPLAALQRIYIISP
jgi:hypothetical protein